MLEDRGGATAASAAHDEAVVEPFSTFGKFGQCITFKDLAKKYQERAAVNRAPEQLPPTNCGSSWLQKLKWSAAAAADAKNSPLLPTNEQASVGRDGAGQPDEHASTDAAVDEPRVPRKSQSSGGDDDHSTSPPDSWSCSGGSSSGGSSIRSGHRKSNASCVTTPSPVSVARGERPAEREQVAANEELWGFAAAAARKKVAPVLHLVKEGAATCYPSYNVFLSGLWSKGAALRKRANSEPTCSRSEASVAAAVASEEAAGDADMSALADPLPLTLSPSKLVRSAVISKQYEHVRRNMLSSNSPFFYVNQLGDVVPSDKETIRKKLIAEATKTRHFQVCRHLNHLSVQPVSVPPPRPYNLSGKRITSYLSKKKNT